MIDHILGRPSSSVRRTQIFMVLFFWVWRLYKGDGSAMRQIPPSAYRSRISARAGASAYGLVPQQKAWWRRVWTLLVARRTGFRWMTRVNQRLKTFTPYQLILGTLTVMYAIRHLDDLLGFGAPEPLATMYSRSYYRATYVNTAFDAGFASAMTIRPKWLKDICSMLFTGYYLLWANEADDTLRRYRALCSVEMLRTTWEKTNNPYIRAITFTHRPRLPIVRHFLISRPKTSSRANLPPVKGTFFFAGTDQELAKCTELVIDFPGGGFVSMGPECHEERLRCWAKRTGKPVLSIDYGKAPEYPYPWAIEEGMDAYRTIMEEKGKMLGIHSGKLAVVLTGDSAGGNICTTIMNRILEHHANIPRPVAIILAYPALDFNYASWMSPNNLRVLQTEQSETNIPGIRDGKDHLSHKSPLSVVDDIGKRKRQVSRSRKSWANSLGGVLGLTPQSKPVPTSRSQPSSPVISNRPFPRRDSGWFATRSERGDSESESEPEDSDDENASLRDADKSLQMRVKTPGVHADERFTGGILCESPARATPVDIGDDSILPAKKKAPIGTRLTMTSRVGYFQDRVITPSMMRAMAILYIGPQRCPDFETDYYISPILTPPHLLENFPPVYVICGERDPFVDDTVIFAGKIREAKRARRRAAEAKMAAGAGIPKFGEGLRMTTGVEKAPEAPDHIVRETDEDWVQMRIIEGWGHGFMQMSALMREVDTVLIEMADWIDECFERDVLLHRDQEDIAAAHAAAKAAFTPDAPVAFSPEDSIPSPLRSRHVKPAREYAKNPANKVLGDADLGDSLGFGDGGDDEGFVTFTPKTKKRTPPPSQFNVVPRRASKEQLARNSSVPRFDFDDSGSSGETMSIETPQQSSFGFPSAPRTGGTFGLFGKAPKRPGAENTVGRNTAASLYGAPSTRRQTPPAAPTAAPASHHLMAGIAASAARAASPALVAAGFKKPEVASLTQHELMRRRRAEAVMGMGETDSAMPSDGSE